MKNVFVFALILAFSCWAEEIDADTRKVLEAINAPLFTLEVHLPEKTSPILFEYKKDLTDSFKLFERVNGDARTGVGPNLIAFSHMIGDIFTRVEKPGLKFVLKSGEDKFTLYPAGLAESAHILKFLLTKEELAEWVKMNVKTSKDAAPIEAFDRTRNFPEGLWDEAKRIDSKLAEAKGPIAAAKAEYEKRRAELNLKLNQSYLYYKSAEKSDWTVVRRGDGWMVATGNGDRMYYTFTIFQLEPTGAGKLRCTKIFAGEFFKGE